MLPTFKSNNTNFSRSRITKKEYYAKLKKITLGLTFIPEKALLLTRPVPVLFGLPLVVLLFALG